MTTVTKRPTRQEYESGIRPTRQEYESTARKVYPAPTEFLRTQEVPSIMAEQWLGEPPKEPEPQRISVWEPTLKERIKNVISDMARRSPFVQPGKRLGQLGLHHLSEAVSGIGLYIPDILASKITKEDTLSSAVDKITGFEPAPRDVGAGEAAKFVTSLHSVGRILGPAVAATKVRPALQIILGSGISFGGRKATEELAKKISTGKPIDVEGIHFESGIGVLFGAGQIGVSKFVNFVKNIRGLPKAQIRPARAEVNAALKHYQKTGDRTRWDAARVKYAGIKLERVPRQVPPEVREFGKYPIARPIKAKAPTFAEIKARPTVPVKLPSKPAKPITKPEAKITPAKAEPAKKTDIVEYLKLKEDFSSMKFNIGSPQAKKLQSLERSLIDADILKTEETYKAPSDLKEKMISRLKAEPAKVPEGWKIQKSGAKYYIYRPDGKFWGERTSEEAAIKYAQVSEKSLREAEPAKVEKKPWEMTRGEFTAYVHDKTRALKMKEPEGLHKSLQNQHKEQVISAIQENKPVPREVLEEYKGEEWARRALRAKLKKEVGISGRKKILQERIRRGEPVPAKLLEEYKSEKWAQEALKEPAKVEKVVGKGKIAIIGIDKEGKAKGWLFEDDYTASQKASALKATPEIKRVGHTKVPAKWTLSQLTKQAKEELRIDDIDWQEPVGVDKRIIKDWLPKIRTKLIEEKVKNLSDAELKRAFKGTAAENRLIEYAKMMRESGDLKYEDIKPVVAPKVEGKYRSESEQLTAKAETKAKETLPIDVKANDIDFQKAVRAASGTHMIPENSAYIKQRDYLNTMMNVYNEMAPLAKSVEQKAILKTELERFKNNYIKWQNDIMGSESGIVSSFIAGPSKFPVRQMNKRQNALQNKINKYFEWKEKAIKSIKKNIKYQAIEDAGGPIAVQEKKIADAEKIQEAMKKANAIIRKEALSDKQKIQQIVKDTVLSESTARKALGPDYMGKKGFAGWQLSNNLANIKRMKQRLSEMKLAAEKTGENIIKTYEGAEAINNFDAERVQLLFDEKPNEDLRNELKRAGWHWSPKNKAWQRKNTEAAIRSAKNILDKHFVEQPPAQVKGKPGFVDLTPIADAGQQIKTTGEKAAKIVTRFGGLEQDVKKTLIEYEEQMKHIAVPIAKENVELYGHLTPKEETAIMNHRELPDKYPLPENLKSVYDTLERRTIERGKRLEELGYTADWPNQYRARLEKRLAKLEARDEPDILAIEMVEKAIEEAKGLRYLHHYYKPQPRARRILSYFKRRISRRPSGLLGRKIPTLEKAKELGLEPAPLAVSEAHADYSMARAEEAARLIEAINKNPNLSQWADDAPEGWVFLDQNIFPESVQKLAWVEEGKVRGKIRRRKFPVPIAEALAELTYVRSPHLLTRWYDKFNFAMKMIGFYNPLVMSKNDLVQGWRAAGVRHLPKLVSATNTFIKKGPKYDRLRRGGLFNNVVSWTPSATDLTQTLLDKIRKTWGQRAAARAAEYLNPLNIVKTIRKFNDATTWNMDEIMRIATYDAIRNMPMTRGMTDFDVIELANDFMVNYAKLPKATKEHLSRVFFVPTYRIGNFRVWFGRMLKHPWRYKGPILRTVGYKMFINFGMPALISAAILWATGVRRKNIRTEKGYRLVIPNPETGKDTVYSLSDPLLEGAKVTQRVIPHTFALNLAAMPSLLLRLASGPRFRNPRDPYGEFFKLGTPIYRDIVNWTDPDKTVPQKILSQLVIAYTYQRKLKPTEEDKRISAAAMARALSIWTEWKEHKKELEKTLGRPIYRWMTTEELQKSYEFNTLSMPYKRKGEPFRPIGAPRKGAEHKVAKLLAEAKRRGIELKRKPGRPPRR